MSVDVPDEDAAVAAVISEHVELLGRLEALASTLTAWHGRCGQLPAAELAWLDQLGAGIAHIDSLLAAARS